ncbi:RNA polymerase sigma factor [Streptacidiphilus cavernicola]|uniref:RNA polymerase sigma factor n=1 Tax=Streptacidiphilus cavernicola TaxID=3342716 RepID=A0ABV6VQA3_9ACTN
MTPTAADPALRHAFLGLLRGLAGAHGLDPEDLEQRVWLRAAAEARVSRPESRLRALTLQEFRLALAEEAEYAAARRAAGPGGVPAEPEPLALAAEQARELRRAVARLPSRCPALMTALLESPPFSYRELAEELAMPRGSIGPTRSRCLGCLRRLLADRRGSRGHSGDLTGIQPDFDRRSTTPRAPGGGPGEVRREFEDWEG